MVWKRKPAGNFSDVMTSVYFAFLLGGVQLIHLTNILRSHCVPDAKLGFIETIVNKMSRQRQIINQFQKQTLTY